ncbi:unnamed protein product, partial [Nesidiocoris tenuis]
MQIYADNNRLEPTNRVSTFSLQVNSRHLKLLPFLIITLISCEVGITGEPRDRPRRWRLMLVLFEAFGIISFASIPTRLGSH